MAPPSNVKFETHSDANDNPDVDLSTLQAVLDAMELQQNQAPVRDIPMASLVAAFMFSLRQFGIQAIPVAASGEPNAPASSPAETQSASAVDDRARAQNNLIDALFEGPVGPIRPIARTAPRRLNNVEIVLVEDSNEDDALSYASEVGVPEVAAAAIATEPVAAPSASAPPIPAPAAGVPTPARVSSIAASAPASTTHAVNAPAASAPASTTPAVNAPAAANPSIMRATPGGDGNEASGNLTGFVCTACNHYNLIRSATDTFYVVTKGKQVGVFKGWPNVSPLVTGV